MNIYYRMAALSILVSIPCLAQTTGTLTILPPPGGSGDIESVGDCLSGACFSSVLPNLVYASPDGISGTPVFRSILLSDLPSTLATDAELDTGILSHSSTPSAHHTWPLTDTEIPDDITILSATDDDLSDNQIGDLLDVDETGASIGEALVSDGSGSWLSSTFPVCLSDGTNCPVSSSSFNSITSGTNTTAAMIVGTGSTLRSTGTGIIGATCIDSDGDGLCEIYRSGNNVFIDPDDNMTDPFEFNVNGLFRGNGPFVYLSGVPSATVAVFRLSSTTGNGLGGADTAPAIIVGGSSKITASATEVTLHVEQVNSPFAQTCLDSGDANPGTLILSVSGTTYKSITNSDSNGCNITVSETGATSGQRLEIIISSNAGGIVTFSDTSGVSEVAGSFLASLYDSITYRYVSDRWVEVSRSDN